MDKDDIRGLLQHIEDHVSYAREALERNDAHAVRVQAVEIKGWAESI